MAQKQVDLLLYVSKLLEQSEDSPQEKNNVCQICEKTVSQGNTARHATYHRKCDFCNDYHYLKDLYSGKCPVYNVLLKKFFPSASDLKIKLF